MNRKQMIALAFGIVAVASSCTTRAETPPATAAQQATQLVVAAKTAWLLSYSMHGTQDIDSARYDIAFAVCYKPNDERELFIDAAKLYYRMKEKDQNISIADAVGVVVVTACNRRLFGDGRIE